MAAFSRSEDQDMLKSRIVRLPSSSVPFTPVKKIVRPRRSEKP
jgi:hypothetical protein